MLKKQELSVRAFVLGLVILGGAVQANKYALSMFWCGFSKDFCGQSTGNDVNAGANIVILAFANTQSNGQITVDETSWPSTLVSDWQKAGKRVLISVGGQNGNWDYVFASTSNSDNFIKSILNVMGKYNLDGVDLDIESYRAPPRTVSNMINDLRREMNMFFTNGLIVVSPEDVAVYQGSPVPDPTMGGIAFNYFVPIIKEAGNSIDLYQVQAYNNWYDGITGGSEEYIRDVYLNWRNFQGLS